MPCDDLDRRVSNTLTEHLAGVDAPGLVRDCRRPGTRLLVTGVEYAERFIKEQAPLAYAEADWLLLDLKTVYSVADRTTRPLTELRGVAEPIITCHLGFEVGGFRETETFRTLAIILGPDFERREPLAETTYPVAVEETRRLVAEESTENRSSRIKISMVMLSGLENGTVFGEMVESFLATVPPSPDIEVVVVCNGSHDDTAATALRRLGRRFDLQLVFPRENTGIAGGFNAGVSRAKGRYVCFIQDDCVFTQPQWHRELAYYLDRYRKIGILGGHRGGFYFRRPTENPWEIPLVSAGSWDWEPLRRSLVRVDSANCVLIMFRRELGLFEEKYLPNGLEDIAFNLRARREGWEVYCTDVGVTHECRDVSRSVTRRSYYTGDMVHRQSRHFHYQQLLHDYGDMLRPLRDDALPELSTFEDTLMTLPKSWRGLNRTPAMQPQTGQPHREPTASR